MPKRAANPEEEHPARGLADQEEPKAKRAANPEEEHPARGLADQEDRHRLKGAGRAASQMGDRQARGVTLFGQRKGASRSAFR